MLRGKVILQKSSLLNMQNDVLTLDTPSSCGRKNRRKNIPTKSVTSLLHLKEEVSEGQEVDDAESSCLDDFPDSSREIDSSASSVKSPQMLQEEVSPHRGDSKMPHGVGDYLENNPGPVDLSMTAHATTAHKRKHQDSVQAAAAAAAVHQQVLSQVAASMGISSQFSMQMLAAWTPPQVAWINVLKPERRGEWRAALQRTLDQLTAAQVRLEDALARVKCEQPITNTDITRVQSDVQKLQTELTGSTQRLGQFQYACESQQQVLPFPMTPTTASQLMRPPASSLSGLQLPKLNASPKLASHNFLSTKDMSTGLGMEEPPLKKKKKDPRCQDDEEANYVDPLWQPIIVMKENVENVKLSSDHEVYLPKLKFEELLTKASSSSTRLLRVLMKHFFTHEQLAAGSLTGEGVYKDKLDENITKSIRDLVSRRHPKLKKAKINLCCTDVCVQARRVNENQRRRVTRVPVLSSSLPEDTLPMQLELDTESPASPASPASEGIPLNLQHVPVMSPLDIDN